MILVVLQATLEQLDCILCAALMMIEITEIVVSHQKTGILLDRLAVQLLSLLGISQLLETVCVIIGNISPVGGQLMSFSKNLQSLFNSILFSVSDSQIIIGFYIVPVQLDGLQIGVDCLVITVGIVINITQQEVYCGKLRLSLPYLPRQFFGLFVIVKGECILGQMKFLANIHKSISVEV